MEEARKFIRNLNGEQSWSTSLLCLNNLVQFSLLLQRQTQLLHDSPVDQPCWIPLLLQAPALVLRALLLVWPLLQAARLSYACDKLRMLALDLRSRPFGYSTHSQFELDSILLYTSNLRLDGRLLWLPIRKSYLLVAGACLTLLILYLGQSTYRQKFAD